VLGFGGVPFCLGDRTEFFAAYVADERFGFFADFEGRRFVFCEVVGLADVFEMSTKCRSISLPI